MTIRTLIFCDVCNPQGIRNIEQRRSSGRNDREGRRISDGRSWYEGRMNDALEHQWKATDDGKHICPYCNSRRNQ